MACFTLASLPVALADISMLCGLGAIPRRKADAADDARNAGRSKSRVPRDGNPTPVPSSTGDGAMRTCLGAAAEPAPSGSMSGVLR